MPGSASIGSFPDGETTIKVEEDVRGKDCFVQHTIAHDNSLVVMHADIRGKIQQVAVHVADAPAGLLHNQGAGRVIPDLLAIARLVG
jgi:hypothetical protein